MNKALGACQQQQRCPKYCFVDRGGENTDLVALMEELRGENRGSAIQGRSVHNQRIERSWRDMWYNVSHQYHDMFSFMEEQGLINLDSTLDMWCLHFVFLPRLNRDLELIASNGTIMVCGLKTTSRHCSCLFSEVWLHTHTVMREFFSAQPPPANADHDLNLAWEEQGPAAAIQNQQDVPLSEARLEELQQEIDPLGDSHGDDTGISTYLAVRDFIRV